MPLKVIGAGVGRTGTMSLKIALERLLNAPCYHMVEVFANPHHVPHWHAAADGRMPDWDELLGGYSASVDWPACAFWPELVDAYPDALVILSLRDPEAWWESASQTIFAGMGDNGPLPDGGPGPEWLAMVKALFAARFGGGPFTREAAIEQFNRNTALARHRVPAGRLLEWRASEGWAPICERLGVPVPEEPFPRVNTREDWANRHNQSFDELIERIRTRNWS